MITPRFTITQSETAITIKIYVPYIRVSDAEIYSEQNEFTFFCKPYYLKLAFAEELASDESCSAKYDPNEDNGVITAELIKLVPGTYFPDLDLPSKLLLNRKLADKNKYQFPSIEVIGEQNNPSNTSEDQNEEEKEGEDPEIDLKDLHVNLLNISSYGFNQKYRGMLKNHREEVLTMLTLSDPDNVPISQRQALRHEHELQSFDPDRYLGDFLEGSQDPIHIESMNFVPFWEKMWTSKKDILKKKSSENSENLNPVEDTIFAEIGGFDEIENETMRRLPQRSYLIPKGSVEERSILLSLIDILFGYCYDHRTTQGESTVESAYTISILSSTLSCLETYFVNNSEAAESAGGSTSLSTSTIREVMIQSARRCLIFPYLRTWKLVKKIFVDVTKILFLGYKCVLKCLLQVHRIFEATDTHYLLNKLFVDDYCMWLQCVGSTEFNSMIEKVAKEYNTQKNSITKNDMFGLNLEELERSVQEEEDNDENEEQQQQQKPQQEQQQEQEKQGNNDQNNAPTQSQSQPQSNINTSLSEIKPEKKPLIEVISSTENENENGNENEHEKEK